MDIENLKSFLRLQVVWKDEHTIKLKVTASNGRYFGTTDVYDTPEPLFKFAETLLEFPQDNSDLFYETGVDNGYASFSMHFYCIDDCEDVGVEINLDDTLRTEFSHEEQNKIKIEIIVQPNAVDNFQKDLLRLATKQEGIVILYGKEGSV